MFSIDSVFALNSVKARILQHFNNESSAKSSETEVSDLRIVGYERPDIVLVTWSSNQTTFIAAYSMDTQNLKVLHTGELATNIFCASVNEDRNLVAFTRGDRTAYEALLAETRSPYRTFSLGQPSKTFPRVQFIESSRETAAKLYNILIIHEREQILLYSLQVGADNRLSQQPKKEKTLTRKHNWFKWDFLCQTLFFIGPKLQKFESTLASNLTLHIYQMGMVSYQERDKRKSMFYQSCPEHSDYIRLWAESEILMPANIQSADLSYFDDMCSPPQSVNTGKAHSYLDIVRSSTGKRDVMILVMRNSNEVHLSVYSSYRSGAVDEETSGMAYSDTYINSSSGAELVNTLLINSNGMSNEYTLPIVIPFAKYLLVYFPGSELHLVDCFDNHEMTNGLVLKEEQLDQTNVGSAWKETFISPSELMNEFPLVQHDMMCCSFYGCIYDKKKGVAYRIVLDLTDQTLLALYKTTCPLHFNSFIHFSVSHAGFWLESREIKQLLTAVIDSTDPGGNLSGVFELLVSSSVNRYLRENETLKQRAFQFLPIDVKPTYFVESWPFEATFRKVEPKTGKILILHLYNSASNLSECAVNVKKIVFEMSTESLSNVPLSCTSLREFLKNPAFIENEYSRLSKNLSKSKFQGNTRKKWDAFMNRFFNPSSSSVQSISGMIEVDDDDDENIHQSSGDMPEFARSCFVGKLSEELCSKIGASGLSGPLSSSSPSSSSLPKSFKNFQISETVSKQESLNEYTAVLASKYSQIQLYNAAMLWNIVSDVIYIVKPHNIVNCSCQNCNGKVLNKYVSNIGTPIFDRRTSALFASQLGENGAASSSLRNSRVDYIANVMRATISSKVSQVSVDLDIMKKLRRDFRIVEQFYMAMEKLCLPLPVELHTKFTMLGFHSLTRMMFVQYLDRGILRVTEGFLKHAIEILDHKPTAHDVKFKLSLMTRLGSHKKQVKIFNQNGYNEFDKLAVGEIMSKLLKEEIQNEKTESVKFMADNVMEYNGVRIRRKESVASKPKANMKNRDSLSFADIMSDISEESGVESALSDTDDARPTVNLRSSKSSPIDMFPHTADQRRPFQSKSAANLRMSSEMSMKLSRSTDTEASTATCSPEENDPSMPDSGVYDFSPSKILLNYLALNGLTDKELSLFDRYLTR